MMIPAGWYPDPEAETEQYRYWDGKTFTARTADAAQLVSQKQKRRAWRRLGIFALVCAIILVAYTAFAWVSSTNQDRRWAAETQQRENQKGKRTIGEPTARADGGIPLGNCPRTTARNPVKPDIAGEAEGGGIIMPIPVGLLAGVGNQDVVPGMRVDEAFTGSDNAFVALGRISQADGMQGLQFSAEQLAGCLAGSPQETKLYKDESTTVADQPAWKVALAADGYVIQIRVIEIAAYPDGYAVIASSYPTTDIDGLKGFKAAVDQAATY